MFLPKTTVTTLLCTQMRHAATPATVTAAQLIALLHSLVILLPQHGGGLLWWGGPLPHMCMYAHACVGAGLYVHTCTHTWKPEASAEWLPTLLSTLVFVMRSLYEPGHFSQAKWPVNPGDTLVSDAPPQHGDTGVPCCT